WSASTVRTACGSTAATARTSPAAAAEAGAPRRAARTSSRLETAPASSRLPRSWDSCTASASPRRSGSRPSSSPGGRFSFAAALGPRRSISRFYPPAAGWNRMAPPRVERAMIPDRAVLVVIGAALAFPVAAGGGKQEAKLKKPHLELRATPRMAFSPVNIFLIAELQGGDDVEEYYCPQLEWDWDDGGKSVHEGDCPPFVTGTTRIERRFTAEHEYRRSGIFTIKVTMRRANRSLAASNVRVTVRPGLGD